jgi:AraC-type DNA-binding domain-containing proteins
MAPLLATDFVSLQEQILHSRMTEKDKNHPSMMSGLFSRIPTDNSALFLIRRLNMSDRKIEMPSDPVRSPIHCFFYITKGEALIEIGEESYFFKEHECAIIPAGQIFSVRYYDDCTGFMGGFHTNFLNTDNEGKNLLHTFGFLRQWGSHKLLFDKEQGNYVINIFERLCTENEAGRNNDIIKAYLTAFLVEVDAVFQKSNLSEDNLNLENRLCNSFIEFVFEQSNHSVSISEYAERLNITPPYLHKIIKRFTGKTPLTWINEAIVLEAKKLLCHTAMTINEIAAKVGINDPSYFSRLFKKQTGLAPVVFRERIKQSTI